MRKYKLWRILLILIILFPLFLWALGCRPLESSDMWTLPCLPRPIAGQAVLITSAGQSTDAYIIRDIANQLMIHNLFMPQAGEINVDGIKTLVVVVGYSPTVMKCQDISLEEEQRRILKLLKQAQDNNLTVVTLYIGGKYRRNKQTDSLLELILPYTHYMISTRDSNSDNFFTDITKKYAIPLTLVNDVKDIEEPFASAFR